MRWIREHVNGWIGEVEADPAEAADDRWHVYAYPTDRSQQSIPAMPNVHGELQARALADQFVQEHAPHECTGCGPWVQVREREEAS